MFWIDKSPTFMPPCLPAVGGVMHTSERRIIARDRRVCEPNKLNAKYVGSTENKATFLSPAFHKNKVSRKINRPLYAQADRKHTENSLSFFWTNLFFFSFIGEHSTTMWTHRHHIRTHTHTHIIGYIVELYREKEQQKKKNGPEKFAFIYFLYMRLNLVCYTL